jgi:hypothetical protein
MKEGPSKRKNGSVRRNCLTYIDELKKRGISNELPLEQAKELFSEIIDRWDRLTIKAYFGTKKHTSRTNIQRIARYAATGTYSFKNIELIRNVSTTKGYLEKMGLATFVLKGSVWFMKVNEAPLVPQLFRKDNSGVSSIDKISLI